MSTKEIQVLVIRHLKDIDAAAKLLENEIQGTIFSKIDTCAEEWVAARPDKGWYGRYGWKEKRALAIAPIAWRVSGSEPKEELFYASFELEGIDSEKDYFWLTTLCKQGGGTMGFSWRFNLEHFTIKKRDWKNFIGPKVDEIRKLGFTYDNTGGTFFMHFEINSEELAKAYEQDNIEDALQPMRQVLDRLDKARGSFDRLIASATKQLIK